MQCGSKVKFDMLVAIPSYLTSIGHAYSVIRKKNHFSDPREGELELSPLQSRYQNNAMVSTSFGVVGIFFDSKWKQSGRPHVSLSWFSKSSF